MDTAPQPEATHRQRKMARFARPPAFDSEGILCYLKVVAVAEDAQMQVVSELAHLVVEAQAQVRWLSVAGFVVESGLADSLLLALIVA